MAYTDPQTITIDSAVSLPRTSSGVNTGGFSANDGTVGLTVSHQYGKRVRRVARVDTSKIAPDPLISSTNIKHSMSAYLVVDMPSTGYTAAEAKKVIDGLAAWLAAGTGAANNTTRLLGGEN